MKSILTITLLVITNLTFGQSNSAKDTLISNPTYDKTLAEKRAGSKKKKDKQKKEAKKRVDEVEG